MRPIPFAAVLVAALLAAGAVGACGSSGAPAAATPPAASASAADSPSVLPQIISSELAVGPNRVIYAFLDPATNSPVSDPDRTADVRFTGPGGEVVETADGRFVWAVEGERGVYVTEAEFPVAGAWTAEFTTTPASGTPETIRFQFDVREDRHVVGVGEPAPAVDTPTLADVGGDPARLSTDPDPDPGLYATSIADALEAGDPFVLVFATPKFCATAQCGPTLDRVKAVADDHPDVTFINVEPYELEERDGQLQPVLAEGQLTPVEAVVAWKLIVEPYVFVVDEDGTITAAFEAIFDEAELDAALEALG